MKPKKVYHTKADKLVSSGILHNIHPAVVLQMAKPSINRMERALSKVRHHFSSCSCCLCYSGMLVIFQIQCQCQVHSSQLSQFSGEPGWDLKNEASREMELVISPVQLRE